MEKMMSNKDTHASAISLRQRVFLVALFMLGLVVSTVVLRYFSPGRTTRSIAPAACVTHLYPWAR
jgi:hypothetical protein